MFWKRSYINTKILILGIITILLLVYVVVLSHLILDRSYEKEKEALVVKSEFAVNAFSVNILQVINQVDMIINGVRMYHTQNSSIESTNLFISGLKIDTLVIENIFIVNETGNFLSPDVHIRSKNVRDRDYYLYHKTMSDDNLFISAVEKGKISGKYRFRVTRRINHPDGSFAGVIIATINPKAISLFFEALTIGNKSVSNLLGIYDTKLRARYPEPEDKFWEISVEMPFWESIEVSKTGSFEYVSKLDNIHRVAMFKKVGDLPLVVTTGFSEEDIQNAIADGKRWLIILELITIIAILIISGVMSIMLINRDKLLMANKELKVLNGKKKRFIRILGHDLINPFNRIIGFSEMLINNIDEFEEDQIKGGSKNSFFSKFSERYQEPVTISCENDIQMKDKSL
ncbi:MAG: hypothetical protein Q7J34_14440 [Bacteroidales bacterium]|nr:hypothetical protein [Bacteroidales bacterium]